MPRPALQPEEKDARRRLKRVTCENAVKVTSKDIYWTLPFLELYLERCDSLALDSPHDGLVLANYAPTLASRIPVNRGPGSYASLEERHSYEVRALAVLATLCRVVDRPRDAEHYYRLAFAIVRERPVKRDARAELIRRHGYLLLRQGKPSCLESLQLAVDEFRQTDDRNGLADALISLGIARYEIQEDVSAGLKLFAEALPVLDASTTRGQESAVVALGNLAYAISLERASITDQDEARGFIYQARVSLSSQPRSIFKAKLLWIEGLLFRNLFFGRHAARLLSRARDMFKALGLLKLYTVVSLDLATVLHEEGETKALNDLRHETLNALRRSAGSPAAENSQLLEKLEPWRDRPTPEALESAKRNIESGSMQSPSRIT